MGAHQPVYFGWQPYLLLATVASCIQAITGCYLLYVIASLYHQLLNINLAFPQWTTRMFISYALIVILCNAVGTAFIFANNELRWSALRVIGISTSFTIAGGHTLLILANLKRMLLMQNNISHGATANSASKDRSFNAPRKTASFPKIQKLKLQQQQQADPEGTAITNRKPESHTDSLFNSARVHQSEQGRSHQHETYREDEEKKGRNASERLFRSLRVSPINVERTGVPSAVSPRQDLTTGITVKRPNTRKLDLLLLAGFVLWLVGSVILVFFVIVLAFSESSSRFSDSVDDESTQYSIGADILYYFSVLLVYFYQYFARIPRSKVGST